MDTSEMKIRQRMEATEEKLILLENAKRRLYQNSSEVKSQIHSQMSRLLEALRNREVQLLNQVDHMQTQREEALHKQHAVLGRTLGQLQRAVVSSEEEDKNLDERFERLSLNDVLPEEIPYMTFKPTPIGLNDLMMNFGKITANGVPLPDNRSASLPKQFEDYGDAEHHVLYKTVEKIQQGLNSEKKIYVKIPRLTTSASNSEWLAKQKSTAATSSSVVGKCMFSPFKESKSDGWLAKTSAPPPTITPVYLPQMAKNTSIQHWLHQIKQNPANEEDGFEMLDKVDFCSDGDSDSIEIVSSSPPSTFHTQQYKTAGDKRSHDVDNSQWLSAKRKVVVIEKPANLPTFSYFKKLAAQDNSIWLAKKKSNSVVTKSGCCGNASKNYDIENLGDCDFIEVLKNNLKTFSPGTRKPLRSKCDENVDSLLPPVSSLCIANEVCEKYSECLSQPSCIEQKWLVKKPDSSPEKKNNSNDSLNKVDDAVLSTKSPSLVNVSKADNKNKEMTALFSPFRKKSATSDWLKKTDKENVPVKGSSLKVNVGSFCQVDDWLFKPNTKRQPAAKFILHQEKDLKSWLVKPTSNDTNLIHG